MSAIFSGCKKDKHDQDDDPNTDDYVFVASAYTDAGQMQIKLYAADSLFAGYNYLFVEVRDSATNNLIDDGHVTITPMMDMGQMMHYAPFENPSATHSHTGLFACQVVFQMPGDMGWTLKVHVHEHVNGGSGEVTFPLMVKNPTPTRARVLTPLNGSDNLIVSYVMPTNPMVGVNDFELTLHTMESMMSFPAEEGYTVEIEPEMLAMGHGSPNNVNPTHDADGHYKGQVNFTMTGLWRINLNIMDGAEVVDSTAYFEVTLQ